PVSIDGCMATWGETEAPNVIRSEMELAGFAKVRRRTTYSTVLVDASVMLPSEVYDDLWSWFRVDCQSGVLPTRFKRPQDGKEIVLRFAAPPAIEWPERESDFFRAVFKLEQLPAWRTLT